jgi:hypothetical protein
VYGNEDEKNQMSIDVNKKKTVRVMGAMGNIIKMQLRRPESTQRDFQKDTIFGHVSLLI